MRPAEAIYLHVLPAGLLLETPAAVRGVTCVEVFLRDKGKDRTATILQEGMDRNG